jgi:hypothetical protein
MPRPPFGSIAAFLAFSVNLAGCCGSSSNGSGSTGTTTATTTGGATGGGSTGSGSATGTSGGSVCTTCFLHGDWQVDNLEPCFVTEGDAGLAISSAVQGGTATCPTSFDAPPTADWSTDSLTIDCSGTYTLCYAIKAGDPKNQLATDCTIIEDCTQPGQAVANMKAAFPDLPGWLSGSDAGGCIAQLENSGGYGAMSVRGTADGCGTVARDDFQYVTYCPINCNGPNPSPNCATCQGGGGGPF